MKNKLLTKIGCFCLAGAALLGSIGMISGCGEKKEDVPEPEQTQISIERIHEIMSESKQLLNESKSQESHYMASSNKTVYADSILHIPFYEYFDGGEETSFSGTNEVINYYVEPLLKLASDVTEKEIDYANNYIWKGYELNEGYPYDIGFTIKAINSTKTEIQMYAFDAYVPYINVVVNTGVNGFEYIVECYNLGNDTTSGVYMTFGKRNNEDFIEEFGCIQFALQHDIYNYKDSKLTLQDINNSGGYNLITMINLRTKNQIEFRVNNNFEKVALAIEDFAKYVDVNKEIQNDENLIEVV